jgi:very-short-patch-repair endonuclease
MSRNPSSALGAPFETQAARLAYSPLEGESNPPFSDLQRAQTLAADLVGGARRGYRRGNIAQAQTLRKNMTQWEGMLWRYLKGKYLGCKFRRQQPIGPYIVDFFNAEKRLIIELDGSQHVDSKKDMIRDRYLASQGYTVLRFWNNEVAGELESVLTRILNVLEATPHQNPFSNSSACEDVGVRDFDSPSRGECARPNVSISSEALSNEAVP